MNNILNFEQYKEKVRLMESMVINQTLDKTVNEGIVTKFRKYRATKRVDKILSAEMELGKQLEERIKNTMGEISEACKKLKMKSSKKNSEFLQKVDEIISDINDMSFNTLSLLGDENIDFSGFRNSVIFANVVKFMVLFSPVKNFLITKKAYNYFIGLVKQTLRRDIVMLQINFDQFQNMILQKALESEENARSVEIIKDEVAKFEGKVTSVIGDVLSHERKKFEAIIKGLEKQKKLMDSLERNNPLAGFFMNSYDNTYKQTAETLKSYINDDSQKQLDALKNGISKIATGNEDMNVFGEILIAAAEEHALKASNTIHSNFLKMSEVFKLSNQKKLVELIMDAEKEAIEEAKKLQEETKKNEMLEKKKKLVDFLESEGEKIFKEKSNPSEWTLAKWDDLNESIKGPDDMVYKKKDVLEKWLQTHPDELKKCDDTLKLAIPVFDDNGNLDSGSEFTSYLDYMNTIVDQLSKCIVQRENGYYIDLYELNSVSEIMKVVDRFKIHKNDKKVSNLKDAFKLINDNVTKFPYESLCDVVENILGNLKGKKYNEVKSDIESDIETLNKHEDELKKSEDFKSYKSYEEEHDKWLNLPSKQQKHKPEPSKVDKPDGYDDKDTRDKYLNYKLKVTSLSKKIGSKKIYDEYESAFEKMKQFRDNGYEEVISDKENKNGEK